MTSVMLGPHGQLAPLVVRCFHELDGERLGRRQIVDAVGRTGAVGSARSRLHAPRRCVHVEMLMSRTTPASVPPLTNPHSTILEHLFDEALCLWHAVSGRGEGMAARGRSLVVQPTVGSWWSKRPTRPAYRSSCSWTRPVCLSASLISRPPVASTDTPAAPTPMVSRPITTSSARGPRPLPFQGGAGRSSGVSSKVRRCGRPSHGCWRWPALLCFAAVLAPGRRWATNRNRSCQVGLASAYPGRTAINPAKIG
jgi:hypothetical protein